MHRIEHPGSGRDFFVIVSVQIAYGGVAPTIVRLPTVEEFVLRKDFSQATFSEAAILAREHVHPISDVRGSNDYRSQLAGNILLKFFAETAHAGLPLLNGHDGNGAAIAEKPSINRFNGEA